MLQRQLERVTPVVTLAETLAVTPAVTPGVTLGVGMKVVKLQLQQRMKIHMMVLALYLGLRHQQGRVMGVMRVMGVKVIQQQLVMKVTQAATLPAVAAVAAVMLAMRVTRVETLLAVVATLVVQTQLAVAAVMVVQGVIPVQTLPAVTAVAAKATVPLLTVLLAKAQQTKKLLQQSLRKPRQTLVMPLQFLQTLLDAAGPSRQHQHPQPHPTSVWLLPLLLHLAARCTTCGLAEASSWSNLSQTWSTLSQTWPTLSQTHSKGSSGPRLLHHWQHLQHKGTSWWLVCLVECQLVAAAAAVLAAAFKAH
jgi:hypothetical protein